MATSKFSLKPTKTTQPITSFQAPKTSATSYQTSPQEMIDRQNAFRNFGKNLGNLGATIYQSPKSNASDSQGNYNNLFVGPGGNTAIGQGTNANNQAPTNTTTTSLAPVAGPTIESPTSSGASAGASGGSSGGSVGAAGGGTALGGSSTVGGPLSGDQQSGLDSDLQKLANLNPELADSIMDRLGYSKALSAGEGQGSSATPKPTSKFQQGFNQASAVMGPAGGNVSGTQGTSLVNQYAPVSGNDTSSAYIQTDPFISELFKTWQDFIKPDNQRKSLTDTYKTMMKDSGVQGIDTELLNMKNVIEGSEEDLRNEITKAGGFATESQIMGLTNARNKQLIKNYNTLLDTRNAKEKYLQTAIGLERDDRNSADQKFESMFSMGTQLATLNNQMQNNAKSQMQWLAEKTGFDGLFESTNGDPYYRSLIEKTLGLPQGGLITAAQNAKLIRTQAQQKEALGLQKLQEDIKMSPLERNLKAEQIKTEKAQQSKLYSDITEKRATTPGTPEYKIAQDKALGSQAIKAEVVLGKVSEANKLAGRLSTGLIGGLTGWLGGTPAKNLRTKIDTIQANISFDTLQEMRNASKTGGALGSISERELELLGSTVASLDVAQSPSELKKSLTQVQEHYTNWLTANGYSVAPDGKIIKITN